MNTPRPDSPRDAQVDALLARRYRDTSPEFEARWVALKRELRQEPVRPRRSAWLASWTQWFALGGAVAAVAITFAVWRKPAPAIAPGEVSPALAELFAMEAVLGRATVLLDAENRDALLHLPAQAQPRS
jgi:hypothetical protein